MERKLNYKEKLFLERVNNCLDAEDISIEKKIYMMAPLVQYLQSGKETEFLKFIHDNLDYYLFYEKDETETYTNGFITLAMDAETFYYKILGKRC